MRTYGLGVCTRTKYPSGKATVRSYVTPGKKKANLNQTDTWELPDGSTASRHHCRPDRIGQVPRGAERGDNGRDCGHHHLEWAEDAKEFVAGSIHVTVPAGSTWTQHRGDLLLQAVGGREAVVDGMHTGSRASRTTVVGTVSTW